MLPSFLLDSILQKIFCLSTLSLWIFFKFSVDISHFLFIPVFLSGLNQVVSEQAVDGSSPLDTMIQRLQQEQDQRMGTNDAAASGVNSRANRGRERS